MTSVWLAISCQKPNFMIIITLSIYIIHAVSIIQIMRANTGIFMLFNFNKPYFYSSFLTNTIVIVIIYLSQHTTTLSGEAHLVCFFCCFFFVTTKSIITTCYISFGNNLEQPFSFFSWNIRLIFLFYARYYCKPCYNIS